MFLTLIHMFSILSFAWAVEVNRIDIESKSQITIGGLFPMHHKGPSDTQPCGSILPEKGIQRVEAMLYAIDEINKNPHYWKFDLGAIILDTCTSDNYALEQSVQFLHATCGNHSSTKKVVGVVGASNSAVSESVANIFRLFKIPQVSYASTSEELDKLHKYPYFFRVVPSDKFQVRVIVDILVEYKWTYVSTVISEGEYGEIAIKTLQGILANETREEICFAKQVTIPRNPTENDFELAITQLNSHKKSKVVIVFMNEDKVKSLLTAVRKSNVHANRFLWIGSDGWGAKMHIVRGNERVAEGAITILPKNYPVKGFDEYFWSLKPETNKRNPWFEEFWEQQFNCSLNSKPSAHPPCTGKEDLKQGYHQESLVPMVIDAVNLLAEAIKSACRTTPGDCNPTSDRGIGFRKLVKEEILKTQINSSQGHDMVIKFDKERNIPTAYKIYQYTKASNGKYEYTEIGEWSLNNRTRYFTAVKRYRLKLQDKARWNNSTSIPTSTCSKKCMKGEERFIKDPHKRCCWECKPCGEEEYMTHEQGYCASCPEGHISTADKSACKALELDYMGRSLKSPWALVPLTFAILGLICTGIVLVVFLLYHNTPIIMAAGRELCYVILFGVALCYCFTFVALSKPSELSCGLLRTGMGLGLSFCYAAIFTKTNRISRIFNRGVRLSKRPSYISPESQLVICSCLILIEVVLTVMWLLISPPTVKQLLLTRRRAFVALCGFDGPSVFVALLYNMLLIVLCTYYAYKTRNIPENFNESKYISFAMYAACIVWLAFIPIHFSAGQDYKVQSSVLCMCVSVSGTVTLACLFLPKVYIVLCKPEKNVRYPSSSPNSSTPNISIAPVRFLRSNQNSPATPHRTPRINTELNGRGDNFLTVNESSTSLNFES